jgi:hypothetical protein
MALPIPRLFERTLEINPADLAQAAFAAGEELEWQKQVVKARAYHAGASFDEELQRKLEQFVIGGDVSDIAGLNIARKVVQSVLRRLSVQGFDVAGDDTTAEALSAWVWDVWKANRMDTRQRRVHRQALVDSESFVIVSYEEDSGVRLTPHQRYTDPQADGDGYGCKAHYPNDDITQPMEYASKRWTETYYEEGRAKTRQRMTLYYPNAVYKYVWGRSGWTPFIEGSFDEDDAGAWPIWWTDTGNQSGQPLGVPVIHFVNPEERPEAVDAWGPQVASDHALVDLIGAAALSAFRVLILKGSHPTTDGQAPASDDSNRLKLQPGVILGIPDPNVGFDSLDPADLSQLMNLINELMVWTAIVTETPISEFTATRQLAAEGTLKQQESALIARVEEKQDVFGDAWEDVFTMARRLENVFGAGGLDEELDVETQWRPGQTRSKEEDIAEIQAKRASGVPWAQLMTEWGYSPDQIAAFEESPERQAAQAAALSMNGQDRG